MLTLILFAVILVFACAIAWSHHTKEDTLTMLRRKWANAWGWVRSWWVRVGKPKLK